ncbi:MAG: cyclase family protein, partial [Hyphomicrobiaceae bacterium]
MKHTVLGMATVMLVGSLATGALALEWTKSKYGADDEIGTANLITPQSVMEAAKLVKTGKTYNLGIVVDSKTPAFPPRSMSV